MCGIAGFLTLNNQQNTESLKQQVSAMTDAIVHRGPDAGECFIDAENGIALGHRRLSIIDLSEHGRQPMLSRSGRYVLSYNGEIYNFQDVRKELEQKNHKFNGHSDTEVLLTCIEEYGLQKALTKISGMFAIALWDKQTKTLSFARDRLGKKPLYYGWNGNTFFFTSELKALHAHKDFKPEIDRKALATFMQRAYVPAPFSIYKNIHKLPQGTYLTVAQNKQKTLTPQKYWDFEALTKQPERNLTDKQAIDELDTLLNNATKQRMISDVPLGSFLSGGIDSSLVTALMQSNSQKPIQTYSIGFEEAGYNEAEDAKRIAQHLKTNHTEFYVTAQDALDTIPQIPEMFDEPFADPSQIPTYLLSKLAKQHVTVALSGDGGDESFYGYSRYQRAMRMHWLHHAGFLSKLAPLIPAKGKNKSRLNALSYYMQAASSQDFYDRSMSYWKGEPITNETLSPLINFGQELPLHDFMMAHDTTCYLSDDILVKVDRASMATSLETRAPLLDHKVVEFAWSLPQNMKHRDGEGKWILKQLLERYLPKHLFDRPKQGFGIPHGEWIRGPLRDWAEELLNEKQLNEQGYLNAPLVRQHWKQHVTGEQDHSYDLWNALMFQAWNQKWGK